MNTHYHYQLVRSRKRRKTISLYVKEDGRIIVYAPSRTPSWEIEKFVERKQSWISERLLEKERSPGPVEKKFVSGEGFLYLGEPLPLQIKDDPDERHPLKLSFGEFILNKSCIERARELFIEWYKKEAKQKLSERMNYYSNRFQLFPKGIKITSAQTRWGSCSRDNQLCFSWRIIMAPLSVLDYVLIHELVHVKEKNHSMKFWSCLESIIPGYKRHRRWLREHESQLKI